jgi:nucleoside-diphosphate-sugar epimerase
MAEAQLHVIFGAGQVGRSLASQLSNSGHSVRTVSLHRPEGVGPDVDCRIADVTDAEAAIDAAKGASVIYQCLGVPYTQWPSKFPPLQRSVIGAAERAEALLVTLENVYGYGDTRGRPLTEDLPLSAATSKGRTRADMTVELLEAERAGRVRIAIGRASDFFGPGVTQSTLGSRVFANAVADKRADFIGNPDLLHTYSYGPDIAAGLITLGTDRRAAGQVWHLPGPETVTTRALIEIIADQVGHSVGIRNVPKVALHVLGVFSPVLRGLAEMSYEFENPFVLDTSKFENTFGAAPTLLATAVGDTIAWYRTQGSVR